MTGIAEIVAKTHLPSASSFKGGSPADEDMVETKESMSRDTDTAFRLLSEWVNFHTGERLHCPSRILVILPRRTVNDTNRNSLSEKSPRFLARQFLSLFDCNLKFRLRSVTCASTHCLLSRTGPFHTSPPTKPQPSGANSSCKFLTSSISAMVLKMGASWEITRCDPIIPYPKVHNLISF